MAKLYTIVARHGDKDSDWLLTPEGAAKMFALTLYLSSRFEIYGLWHSGAIRTIQCALVCTAALPGFEGPIEECKSFNPGKLIGSIYGKDAIQFEEEIREITATKNTVAAAREISKYAELATEQISDAIAELASSVPDLVISHSPFASLGTPDHQAGEIMYDIPEGSCVIYEVKGREIVSAEYVEPKYPAD